MIEVSPEQTRRFILETQGLRTKKPCKSVMDVARRVHNIQIDTISVVARSHDLTTRNRLSDYTEGEIWNRLREGSLFEYWSHGICLMPMDSYRFSAWRKKFYHDEMWGSFRTWSIKDEEIIKQVYGKVKREGAVNSASLGGKRTGPSTGWWDWKVEKRALEYLFYTGKLMIAYREGFQKFYDLPDRVIPAGIDTTPLPDDEAAQYVVESTLNSLGVGTHQDIRTYHGTMPSKKLWRNNRVKVEEYIDSLSKDGFLEEVRISGLKDRYFALTESADRLQSITSNDDETAPAKILSPFDNILRERHLPKKVWDFEYSIECYLPPKDRVYGYFVLPILDLNHLAGRIDAKVHRKEGLLEIKSIYLENATLKSEDGMQRLKSGLEDFASFHRCDKITVNRVIPRRMTKAVRSFLAG
jgi:uncharacterized protein YcaQ